MKFTITSIALAVVGLLFMDSPERQANRLNDRMNSAQIQEAIITINHLSTVVPNKVLDEATILYAPIN